MKSTNWYDGPSLFDKIKFLEDENVGTTNCIYELHNRIDMLEYNLMYDDLTQFERSLARFGDKVDLIVGLELGDKISPEDAYQQIKVLYKELKKLRKVEKSEWESENGSL